MAAGAIGGLEQDLAALDGGVIGRARRHRQREAQSRDRSPALRRGSPSGGG
jgi:hypothetical protein